MKIRIVQTCVPDYRLGFFSLLAKSVCGLTVYSGETYYQSSIKDAALGQCWHRMLENRFLYGRRLLWQRLPGCLFTIENVVIAELNPRNLSTWILAVWRKLIDRPVVLWGHAWSREGRGSRTTFLRMLMWRLADARIVYTERQVQELTAELPGPTFPARNSLYSKAQATSFKVSEPFRFLYVGRLVADKKPMLMIRAFARFASFAPGAHLDVVGDGPEKESLMAVADELGVADRVTFHGHVSDKEYLGSLYGDAVAALSPGYVGLSATQAFFHGTPMIVGRDEPHSPEIEACVEGFNTLYFTSDSVSDLHDQLMRLWTERAAWREKAPAIAEDAAARYSIEKMVEAFQSASSAALLPAQQQVTI
jgi:Glycosyltransferase